MNEYVRTRLSKIYTRELVDVIFEQPDCRIGNLVDKGFAQRQAASRSLHYFSAARYRVSFSPMKVSTSRSAAIFS